MPGLAAKYDGKVSFDDWPRNPWTLGAYSYWKVGQYTRFAGVESEIEGACHFAGEHTSVDSQGYPNGAVKSGERAAREVLAALGSIAKPWPMPPVALQEARPAPSVRGSLSSYCSCSPA